MRNRFLWNDGWLFTKEGTEEKITLPHTWNAKDGQTGPEQYYRGECIYKKCFDKPVMGDDDRCYLEFRGVNSSCVFSINGKKISSHDGGYSTFRVDITQFLEEKNEVEVVVSNLPNDKVYPQKADFTFYGGIYRDVYMLIVDKNHFDLDYYGGEGLYITPSLNGDKALVKFRTYSVGDADSVLISIDRVGEMAFKIENNLAEGIIEIDSPHLWNGLEDPFLYKVTATLLKDGRVCDRLYDRFGIRSFQVDPEKGFFLNGKSYPLRGVSRHQDRADVGNALTKEMHEEDLQLIMSMGANSIRLAHYQHDQFFYDMCDEKGIIVWAEIPYITVHMDNGKENTISQMKELIIQNYNHASIMCWAMSNEISLQGVTDELMENHRILNDLVHRYDPIRFSAMANLFLLETDSPLITLPDIRGFNLYYGWYVGEMEDNDKWFDDFHREHPDVAIGLTEYGADACINLQSPRPEKGDFTEGYQALYHEHMLELFSKRPYIWGTFLWNMFEFAAAGRDEVGDPGKNHKGLITFDRKCKKDAYYIYKAWWTDEPFIHLCGKRYRDRIEDNTEIKVYSNLPEVTLIVDGEVKKTIRGSRVFRFNVDIYGEHLVRAVSGSCSDEMEIRKVSEVNPSYFISADKVKNWFDEPKEDAADSEFFSINDSICEIEQTPEGKAIIDELNEYMNSRSAGGIGEGVKIPKAMQEMISRQPLKKLLQQGGLDLNGETVRQLKESLSRIKKDIGNHNEKIQK